MSNVRAVAVIEETACIGCTLCIQACPVDAIVGAAKLMHTVIADECTGCELCVPPCPVDCVVMQPRPIARTAEQRRHAAAQARRRHKAKTARIARERASPEMRPEASRNTAQERKRAVERAMARAQLRLQQRGR
jgi:electron transport complex protein RnfB